ncbi:MAG: methyltransferase domain-containing protein [Rhodospirillales bacterium]|nr:methyltransferase domain-containing protein [Rhodospirillales bacterium]
MRRSHFAAFAPICPRCAGAGAGAHKLRLAEILAERDGDVLQGILHCPNPECVLEFPIVDGIPLILPDPRAALAERGVEWLLREDLDPRLESLLGDALGPGSWLDATRQTVSTYAWDGWADCDPEERSLPGGPEPGAARRCLARLGELAGAATPAGRVLDLGCGVGRTSFDLAARDPAALVLGIDMQPALLRLARHALGGRIAYPRRRIGVVYDRREFSVAPAGAERVDFWAADAQALPFAAGVAGLAVGLNLLDCVPEPARLLAEMARAVAPGGQVWLACPYDWSTRATPMETWIGGHSQRADHAGAAEEFLRTLLTAGAHPRAISGVRIAGEDTAFPWRTRLHDRASVSYLTHLLALARTE